MSKLIEALRPFAMYADSLYALKDDDKVVGIHVRHFREAARLVHAFDTVADMQREMKPSEAAGESK